MISSIANAAIWVSDLARSERFYVDGLGLDPVARIETPEVRELIVGRGDAGGQVMLSCLVAGGPAPEVRIPDAVVPSPGSSPVGFWKTFLWSDNVPDDVSRALGAGGSLVAEPHTLADYGLTIAVVADPDGHLVEIGCFD